MHNKYKLYVISHTHWDREWYQTFQSFRRRLVLMLDELIDQMEKDPDYRYFHMDGQTIVLEDYLQIRPENKQRLRTLISEGRIIIGPWYVMPDEFLLSGESLVRNLQKGHSICREYGVEAMKCGYVTDIFGHNSQFPQILKGFGIDSAILYRGIGDYPKDTFKWTAADGSSVLCMKLDPDRSYSNFYFAVRWPFEGREQDIEEAVDRMRTHLKAQGDRAVSENLLMMDGVDHIEMASDLPELLELFNEKIPDIEIKHTRLQDYIQAQKNSGAKLDELSGELYNAGRQGVNNQVLKNVLSSMVHIKQMNNECETLLTRWAEPFDAAAGYLAPQNNYGFLEEAWKLLLQNHPHDSICGCSISRVHKDNEYRYDQVKDIGEDIISQVLGSIAVAIDTKAYDRDSSLILYNASQAAINGVVEAELEFPADSQGNFRIFDPAGNSVPYQVLGVKKSVTKHIIKFRRLIDFQPKDVYLVAFKAAIPALGYSAYSYEEYKNVPPGHGDYTFKEFYAPVRYPGIMQTGHRTWENEHITVSITENGTLDVLNKGTGKQYKDILIFEDCADIGEGWNYRKPLKDSKFLSINGNYDFSVEYDGPMAVQLRITHRMELPVMMNENCTARSEEKKLFSITTLVTMKKDRPRLEFKTFIDNNVGEHRVRVLFPTYLETSKFSSATPYFLQERDIMKPDRSTYAEVETGVYPNQGIVTIKDGKDCVALYNKGLYEIEVTEDASRTLALTLFRSFRNEVGRDRGEMSFMYRKMTFEYALEFASGGMEPGEAMISGEAWRMGIRTVCEPGHEGNLPVALSFLEVDIPGAVLSAFKTRRDGMKIVRLYNCSKNKTAGRIKLDREPGEAYVLDLNEEINEALKVDDRSICLELKPAQILTIGFK